MKNFLKIFILVITVLLTFGSFSGAVLAIAPLDVQFIPDPLFNQPNFLPLDEVSGNVTVANNSGTAQNILTEAINISDGNNFGSLLNLKIEGDSTTYFNNSLADFFSTAGEVPLGVVADGGSRIFTYTISFINSSDNSYQGKTLGFDVCVGFEGGTSHCGDTVIGDEDDTDGEGGNGGGGGTSSGSRPTSLIIFNEQALPEASGTAEITWDTNRLSTSQVIYGLESEGPYVLDLTPPDFGYPFYTDEDPTKVISHSMPLAGLIPGEIYVYRVISRASPPTISPEYQFIIPVSAPIPGPGLALGASTGDETGGSGPEGEVLGESTEIPNENLAAVLASGFGNFSSACLLIALLVLSIIYLIWKLWIRQRYEQAGIPEEEIKNRFFLFFGASSLLAILISVILGQYCPLLIFIVAFVISVGGYLYRKYRTG